MKKCSISSLLSIIVTLISIFICFTTMFTNIYNNTDFNFGISQEQLSLLSQLLLIL